MPFRSAVLVVALLLAAAVPAADASKRPTEPGTGAYGLPNYQVAEEPPHCSEDVCVHWVATTADAPADLSDDDADGVPDAIELLRFGLQRAHDHMTETLGWREPVSDGTLGGGDGLSDTYVKRLNGNAAGVAIRDEGADFYRPAGFVVVDSVFLAPANLGFAQRKLAPHELQHLIEFAYDGYFEGWHGEATAEWAAAQSDGSYALLGGYPEAWARTTEYPLLGVRDPETGAPPGKGYAAVIWQRWLTDRYGPELIRALWEHADTVNPHSFVPSSVETALEGRSGFIEEFVTFAVRHAEWRLPPAGLGWGSGVPDVERVAQLVPGGEARTATLDHTTFALMDVPVSATATSYELRASAPAGTRSAFALVGRRGDATGGTTETVVQHAPSGGDVVLGLRDPAQFERITAVLVNSDVSIAAPSRDEWWDWIYARDAQALTARIVPTDRPPPPVDPIDSPLPPPPEPERPLPPPPPPVPEDLAPPSLRLGDLPRGALR
ncbi:MAG TPA: hypothetical protein VGW10_15925, partial [Solirubrobacteraceae bacterium]|nr:hypothetical protein [Solirubrobacteraceae bacterium]